MAACYNSTKMKRRNFIQSAGLIPFLNFKATKSIGVPNISPNRFKISLNAYSFNDFLTKHSLTLEELIIFCSENNFDAVDLTGYYFPNYPEVPADDYIFHIKNLVHKNGLSISGTGIRNDFSDPDESKRAKEILFIKQWIDVAAKLGAPVLRIFTGKKLPDNYEWKQVADWMIQDIKICVDYAKKNGVIIGMQNHNDFVLTADQAIYFAERLDKDWFGLIVDTGSFVKNNAYTEIEKAAPHAVNWQIKELVTINGQIEKMELNRLFKIIFNSTYKVYLPIETLSKGDQKQIIPEFYKSVHNAMLKAQL